MTMDPLSWGMRPFLAWMSLAVTLAPSMSEAAKLRVYIMAGEENMVGDSDVRTMAGLYAEDWVPSKEEIKKYGLDAKEPKDRRPKDDLEEYLAQLNDAAWVENKERIRGKYFPKVPFPATQQQIRRFKRELKDVPDDASRAAVSQQYSETFGTPFDDRVYIVQVGDVSENLKRRNLYDLWGQDRFVAHGPLGFGYAVNRNSDLLAKTAIGSEYSFGMALAENTTDPILIIKAAWKDTALEDAWLPPTEWRNDELKREPCIDRRNQDNRPNADPESRCLGWAASETKVAVDKILANLRFFHPSFKPEDGYDMGGFVWVHGATDEANGNSEKQYERQLNSQIQYFRDTYANGQEDVPFVISVLGTSRKSSDIADAQRDVAEADHFTVAVETRPFFPTTVDVAYRAQRLSLFRAHSGSSVPESTTYHRNMPFHLMVGEAAASALGRSANCAKPASDNEKCAAVTPYNCQQCQDGFFCEDGQCREVCPKPLEENDRCKIPDSSDSSDCPICEDDLECRGGRCREECAAPGEMDDECKSPDSSDSSDSADCQQCQDGLDCRGDRCLEPCSKPGDKGDECVSPDSSDSSDSAECQQCKDGLTCEDNECVKECPAPIRKNKKCKIPDSSSSDSDDSEECQICEGELECRHKYCLEVCPAPAEENEKCADGYRCDECAGDLECRDGRCKQECPAPAEEDDKCVDVSGCDECAGDLECRDGRCKQECPAPAEEDKECVDVSGCDECAGDLECRDGRCKQECPAPVEKDGECFEVDGCEACAGDLECRGDKCREQCRPTGKVGDKCLLLPLFCDRCEEGLGCFNRKCAECPAPGQEGEDCKIRSGGCPRCADGLACKQRKCQA